MNWRKLEGCLSGGLGVVSSELKPLQVGQETLFCKTPLLPRNGPRAPNLFPLPSCQLASCQLACLPLSQH